MEKITPVDITTVDDRALLYYTIMFSQNNDSKSQAILWKPGMPKFSDILYKSILDPNLKTLFEKSQEIYYDRNQRDDFINGLFGEDKLSNMNMYLFGAGVRAGLLGDNDYGLRAFLPPKKGRIDQIGRFGHFRFNYSMGAYQARIIRKEVIKGTIDDLF